HAEYSVVVGAGEVPAYPVFHLDHPCAEITQVPAAERRGHRLFERDHRESSQWERHSGNLSDLVVAGAMEATHSPEQRIPMLPVSLTLWVGYWVISNLGPAN